MQVFHLSHIDLDGYGCQYLAREFFEDITFFNANYGKEIMVRLQDILRLIQKPADDLDRLGEKFRTKNNKPEKILILITDLNLSLQESKFLQESVDSIRLGLNGNPIKEIEILLLDHHISGEESAKEFSWYHLDITRCASKITYETLKSRFNLLNPSNEKFLTSLVQVINAVDIWRENDEGFELGKVAMGMIASSNELNRFMFDTHNRSYKFKLLDSLKEFIHLPDAPVSFDNAIFRLKKIALGGDPNQDTMDNIISLAQVKLLESMKEKCSVTYQEKQGFLSYSMGGVSVLANLFLRRNPEFDFYIDANSKGNISLRANGKCDVSTLAQHCFNGGGHKNASGGRCDGFRESFLYEDIKTQISSALKKIK